MLIRAATVDDFDEIWGIFHETVSTATSYVYDPHTSKDQAFEIWMKRPLKTFVCLDSKNSICGTYYIKENRPDLGSHVCRCGFMVASKSRRHGVGEAMCRHACELAPSFGFRAIQLSYVVSTNEASVKLWLKMGFQQVGRVPKAFQHAELGDVDVLIFYKRLLD